MSDAGEGLIDSDARIQERMEELARERVPQPFRHHIDPDQVRAIETLRLARTELERQLAATTHTGRRAQLGLAMEEIERRMKEMRASGC